MEFFLEKIFFTSNECKSRVAIKINQEEITYEELINESLKIASFLKSLSVRNKTIGILGQKDKTSYIAMLGILFAGCNFTPLILENESQRLKDIIKDANIKNIIGSKSNVSNFLSWHKNQSDLDQIETALHPFEYVKKKTRKEIFDKKFIDNLEINNNFEILDKELLAYVLYTSGSTGKPKGVKITLNNLNSYLNSLSKTWKISGEFRMTQSYDFRFDPSISDIFYTISNKGTLVVLKADELLFPGDLIKNEKIDIWTSVPSIAIFMSKLGHLEFNCFPNLKIIYLCGEPFPVNLAKELQKAAPNASIENHYGPTESTITITRYVFNKNNLNIFRNGILPIGKSYTDTEIKILKDNLEPSKTSNEEGEIIFSGAQLSKGYLNNIQKTESSFVKFDWDSENRIWYKSGDRGIINNEGDIECLGRIDSQFKIAGKRVEAGEIEAQLSKYEVTKYSIVVPYKGKNQISLYCVAFILEELTPSKLEDVKKEFTKYFDIIFFPKKFFQIKEFPKTKTGKIDRKFLEERAKILLKINS